MKYNKIISGSYLVFLFFSYSYQLAAYVAENALIFLWNIRKESHTFYEGINSIIDPSVSQFWTN